MKKIRIKPEFKPFNAILSGDTSVEINSSWTPVPPEIAKSIDERWGALVEIVDMPIEEGIAHIQAEVKADVPTKAVEDVPIKKTTKAKKDGTVTN